MLIVSPKIMFSFISQHLQRQCTSQIFISEHVYLGVCFTCLFCILVAGGVRCVTSRRIFGWTWQTAKCCVVAGILMALGATTTPFSTSRRQDTHLLSNLVPSLQMEQVRRWHSDLYMLKSNWNLIAFFKTMFGKSSHVIRLLLQWNSQIKLCPMSFPNQFSFTSMENVMRSRMWRTTHKDLWIDSSGAKRTWLYID